jgi:uncharacterized membrane protein YcaP (DUF421 family)
LPEVQVIVLPVLLEMLSVALHTVLLYIFIILSLSLFARRQVSELTMTELAIVMLLGSSVETSMVAGDVSLLAGLTSAGVLLLSNRALSLGINRWNWFREVFVGRPAILVYKGRLISSQMRRMGLTEEDVHEGIREMGYDGLNEVKLAVREIDGTISVVPQDQPPREAKA